MGREDLADAPRCGFRSETGQSHVVPRPGVSGEQAERITIVMELNLRELSLEAQPCREIEFHRSSKAFVGEPGAKPCRTRRMGSSLLAILRYLNGVEVARVPRWTTGYIEFSLDAESANALRNGHNALAIHCRQNSGGQYIDAGLIEYSEPKSLNRHETTRIHQTLRQRCRFPRAFVAFPTPTGGVIIRWWLAS